MRRSLIGSATSGAWLPQFGEFAFLPPNTIDVRSGTPVNDRFHAEAHCDRVLGADFTYSADITGNWTDPDLSADLQFRISDEGRYGVRVTAGRVVFYRFALEERKCADDPNVVAHCPLWPEEADAPMEVPLCSRAFESAIATIRLTVLAEGSRFTVSLGTPTREVSSFQVDDLTLGIGRFGIYARAATSLFAIAFSNVQATADPTALSNFALLYSTPGYDLDGTKRALVRTINDIDLEDFDEPNSMFNVWSAGGRLIVDGRRFDVAGAASALRRTLGFQFLAADFSDLREPGRYTLEACVMTSSGARILRSLPFEIARGLVSERMLWPLSVLNAKARRAAEDDFRRGWFIESGRNAWSVGLDGAFVADRADDQGGAVLRRVFTIGSRPLSAVNFRFVASITIVSGCDAQLQFRITDNERWAVTLQAGGAGGCAHGGGPGAVRLHHEGLGALGEYYFRPVDSHRLDAAPFEVGRAYDVEIRALNEHIEVMLDGVRVIHFSGATNPSRPGSFALKAWGATVRFENVKVWARNVGLSRPVPGVWIPFNRATGQSSQGFAITTPDWENNGLPPDRSDELQFPLAAQQHGFNDCNSYIGEVTSHSVFLATLMQVWTTRAHAATEAQQEDLRRAIVTAVLYLNELYEQGNRSGAFAHQEPGRAVLATNSVQVLTTSFALYGLAAFAAMGSAVDRKLARQAFDRASQAWHWLDEHGGRDPVLDSIATLRLARAAEREGIGHETWLALAQTAACEVLAAFAPAESMATRFRSTLRSLPWFEGIYEAFFQGPFMLSVAQRAQVAGIAAQLTMLMNDPANGFCLMPQADDSRSPPELDLTMPRRNWNNIADLPLVYVPIPNPPGSSVGHWYISLHFAAAAADCVYLGRLANERALERLATGNLSWMLGLNPGIPATKVVAPGSLGTPWSAASFVYNGPGSFARTIEGERVQTKCSKGWLAEWEKPASSRHRESWAFDPGNTGFQSIVNGHVLRQNQWHYWSVGLAGWVSAETFMLIDAIFLKAALAMEDWNTGSTLDRDTPYDVNRFHFFDTTHFDRAATLWLFDDPERVPAAQAWRMATDFAGSKGFGGGRLTGHHLGELVGVLCLPVAGTTFRDIPLDEIASTRFPFSDIDGAPWPQAGRAAMEIAARHGAAAGFFTGHTLSGKCGWIGLDSRLVTIFDVDDETVARSQWAFADISTVAWAQAARLATDVCAQLGFLGGFFSGHQLPGKRQIVAFRQT